MRRSMFKLLAVFLLSGATTFAGSFTADFTSPTPTGYTLNILTDTNNYAYPIVTNSELELLYNEPNLGNVSMVVNDLDNGAAIDSFTASFGLQIGPGSSTPADGMAFAFGPDITQFATYNEEGPAMSSGGICICFVTYAGDGPGVGVNVRTFDDATALGGIVPGGYAPMVNTTMVDSQMHDVWMQVKRNGMFNMVWNGQVVFTNLFLVSSNGIWAPTQGQFAFGGRNGGDSEEILITNLSITTTVAPAKPVAPIITSQPQSLTVNEGLTASFPVGFDGDAPFTFKWTANGVAITDATNSTLTLLQVSYTMNNAQIACTLSDPSGSITSQAATLTVIKDTTPPTVTNTAADITFTNVTVFFSEPVSGTALTTSNYKMDQGVTVLSATRVNSSTVTLATSKLAPGGVYTLTISGVQDLAATPNTIAAGTQVQVRSFVFLADTILHKKYNNCNDSYTLANFLADPRYPNNPDRQDIELTMEYPPGGNGRVAADPVRNYVDTLEGFFIPPTSGNYIFYVCGDDEYYLYLSTDDNPANMHEICAEPGGWSDNRAWCSSSTTGDPGNAGFHSGTAENWVSSTSTAASANWPGGNTITLTAGSSYYMFAIHHDHSWSGGDWFGVTYQGPNDATAPADGDASKLIGSLVGYDFDPTGASITFTEQPQDVTAKQGTNASFAALATGSSDYGTNVIYQWQLAPAGSSTWTNITGATTAALATPPLALTDSGTQYRVVATVAPISATSSVATVTVVVDTTPPVASAGAMMDPTAGTVDVGVGFNKPMNEVSGSLLSNYSISSGTITSITWATNRFTPNSKNPLATVRKQSALLTVTGLSGNSGTLSINNLVDAYGNKLASTNITFTVATNLSWGSVGANVLGGWQAAVPVGPGDFDVYSDGIAEWTTYDETTFVYEKVTGDFDKKLRVEYQDGSSEWGRAGIIVRDVPNFGVNAVTQSGSTNTAPPYDGTAGRYQKCHVNPVGATLTGPGTAGNANWEGNRRLDTGGACTSADTGVAHTPLYPNAWCRIQRKGQVFTIFRSDDGVNWVSLGTTTWGVDDQTKTPMPDTLYVGPEFSPENGNIPQTGDRGTFLAQFRDYGDYVAVFNPQLAIGVNAGKITVTWAAGTLVSSPTANGPYTPVTGATSPYLVNPAAGKAMFYRIMQ